MGLGKIRRIGRNNGPKLQLWEKWFVFGMEIP
jgi:hypothetical protein